LNDPEAKYAELDETITALCQLHNARH
jgi:hypothetical protein